MGKGQGDVTVAKGEKGLRVLLVVYDNDSFISMFPIGTVAVADALRRAGAEVKIWHQDVMHDENRKLLDIVREYNPEIVGLGFVAGYYQYERARVLGNILYRHRKKGKGGCRFVLGGHGPAGAPEFFLDRLHADLVVVGEIESVVERVLDPEIRGVIEGPPVNVNDLPMIDYDGIVGRELMRYYRLMRLPGIRRSQFAFPILTGRGCKYACGFCYRMHGRLRIREDEAILDEMVWLQKRYGINRFQFADELFMSDPDRVTNFLAKFRKKFKSRKPEWDCNGSIRIAARSWEILKDMAYSGCRYVNYGCESLSDDALRAMGKPQTVEEIYAAVNETIRVGMIPGCNFMWGVPKDDEKNLWNMRDFLVKYTRVEEKRSIRPMTPYPGSRFYEELKAEGRIRDAAHFYEELHTNSDLFSAHFMDMSNQMANRLLGEANREILRAWYNRAAEAEWKRARAMYSGVNPHWRGFRDV